MVNQDAFGEQLVEVLNKLIDNKQTEEFIMIWQKYQHVNLNIKCRSGWNPLHFASYLGNKPIVAYLLSNQDVDPNSETKDLLTPLHLAILNEHIEIVKILCENPKVDVNLSHSSIHGTPLFNAAKSGN